MREGMRTALLEKGRLDDGIVKRAEVATEEAVPESRVQAGLEVLIGMAETDPAAARLALHEFRTDHPRQTKLEAWLGGDPPRATFGLGAAMQIVDTELTANSPDLEALVPELLLWLEGRW